MNTFPKIMVVDDDLFMREMVIDILDDRYQIFSAGSGADAIKQVESDLPDLILLDVEMPGMDGYETCRRLKKIPATNKVPVIFVSGSVEIFNKVLAFELGAVDFITKPYHREELNARVRTHYELYRLRNELEGLVEKRTVDLKESENKFRVLYESASDCLMLMSTDSRIVDINHIGHERLGYTKEEMIGHSIAEFDTPEFAHKVPERVAEIMQKGGATFESAHILKNGLIMPVDVTCKLVEIHGEKILYSIVRDVTEKKTTSERIENLTNYDRLTGLPNRTLLEDRFNYALSVSQRNHEKMCLMMIDLDHFKDINDSLGHSIGDQLLVEMAKRIKSELRLLDVVSRIGGDEFILVCPDTDSEGAALVANKLVASIAHPFIIGQHELTVTSSIGISVYPNDGDTLEALHKNAETATYRAKQDGRNAFCFYAAEMHEHLTRTLLLSNSLRYAIARNELFLHYQPQISLQDGHVTGAEVLLRWKHPEFGMISPAEFIPIAEENGQIIQIGQWVLQTAVNQLKSWLDKGMRPILIAVNLSAVQFRQANLTELVTSILDEAKLPHEYLELELTEAVAMGNAQAAVNVMNKLYEKGIRMSIDDFGTGYSSLSYLKKFKVYKLKIDQSFVRDISLDAEDKAIVGTIISLAASLGLRTIAEGVETAEQLSYLRLQGCDEVQGYYFSRPLPVEQFEKFMEGN